MSVNLITHDERWQIEESRILFVVKAVRDHLGVPEDEEVALVLMNDAEIQGYNAQYRQKDKPTNVLSFPSTDEYEWGDVMFSYDRVAEEADTQGKSFNDHFLHLLVHGLLHISGYDHEEDAEAEEMEALEVTILSKLGIANPYV
ncbi:MAG: rRNA maturation RNase YbeY [Rickettsiales bacterium]|nr:rRNA maturation RNase YbeY [Rickettsiales bacterium]|tara:strand:+ start:88 stop:519 length:432 start_codon:yes stop_codon:yes gene_type:complete